MKRILDIVLAITLMVAFLPLFAIVAIAIRVNLGSPVLFKQQRPGLHEKTFTLVKFRTMRDTTDGEGKPLSDEERLTRFGRFLRSTSLDELPELWNVLKGEMSFVGPRPLLVQYLPLYSPEQRRRHEVRPGLTGWAQINGRNGLSWSDKFRQDIWYVDNHSLILDFRILLRTVVIVVQRDGVNANDHATMSAFQGND